MAAKEPTGIPTRKGKEGPLPVIPGLNYTEGDERFVLLRLHAGHGQIQPTILRRMRREDLEYLAGMTEMNTVEAEKGDENYLQELKVVENAVRSTRELARRDALRIQVAAAMSGGALAAVAAVIAAIAAG